MLKKLLDAVKLQTCPYNIEIVIVDNDKFGSAKNIVMSFAEDIGHQVKYLIEAEQNISLARNKAVLSSSGELIAFIDDDEIPNPDWLKHLTECLLNNNADAVFGPVNAMLPSSSPKWVWESRLFEPLQLETGALIPIENTATGNVLLKKTILDRLQGPFDPKYGLSGGGDYEMFTRYHKIAPQLIWCKEAEVSEHVPQARTKLGWILKRGFRCGINAVQINKSKKLELSSIAYFLGAGTLGALGFFFIRGKSFKYLRVASYYLGRVLGTFGYRYFEYKR